MNQEEEAPARVTRGALRRRSVDQEATPQKPTPSTSSGTPKKPSSTAKKAPGLNAIQENTGRPATPTGGRGTRRRISESIDTPTMATNKLVQNLKEAESSGAPGRRSRNSSLTEENLNELNAIHDGPSTSYRARTPVRLRASQEVAAAGLPQTAPPALRRSTRRNSVTSDDGNSSVQSLPLTTPKSHGLQVIKDEVIEEEDDRSDSVSSETSSVRATRRQSGAMGKPMSPSRRSIGSSPSLNIKDETTPPRGVSKSPRLGVSPLTLKSSPSSKNVSFVEDTKHDDEQSSYPKTPTSTRKTFTLVVEDLRTTGILPKENAEISLSSGFMLDKLGSGTKKADEKVFSPSSKPSTDVTSDSNVSMETNATLKSAMDTSPSQTTPSRGRVARDDASKDMSGIEALGTSLLERSVTTTDATPNANGSSPRLNSSMSKDELSNSWNHSVRGSSKKGIDQFSIRKQEEEEKERVKQQQLDLSLKAAAEKRRSVEPKQDVEECLEEEEAGDEEEEEEQTSVLRNEFADDEAMEVDEYESCDSMDSDLRKEMAENAIPEHSEELGSDDTEEEPEDTDELEAMNNSFIVSDDDGEELDEDKLLGENTDDDDLLIAEEVDQGKQPTERKQRRRIIEIDDSDDEESSTAKDATSVGDVSVTGTPKPVQASPTPEKKALDRSQAEGTPAPKQGSTVTPKSTPNKSPSHVSNDQSVKGTVPKSAEKKPASETKELDRSQHENVPEPPPNETSIITPKKQAAQSPAKARPSLATPVAQKLPTEKNAVEEEVATVDEENETSFNGTEDVESVQSSKPEENELPTPDVASCSPKPVQTVGARKSLSVEFASPKKVDVSCQSVHNSFKVATNEEPEVAAEDNKNGAKQPQQEVTPGKSVPEQMFELQQPEGEVSKPEPASMPTMSLISAQFYLGGNIKKKNPAEKVTSTPKAPPKAATSKLNKSMPEKPSPAEGLLVRNPFAQATNGKAKSRLSLDAAESGPVQKVKKARHSLPADFVEEDQPTTEEVTNGGSSAENGPAPAQSPVEPMEVDEDEEEVVVIANGDDAADGKTAQEKKPSPPKGRPKKALEEYDLENILSRCNEVLRVDKERKKEHASIFRKKKEEKKRLRELEEQQERENGSAVKASTDDDVDNGNDSLKKKKKRKPKVKNYLLEELAETKQERLQRALKHRLEVIERRKMRKKDRLQEKRDQLDKENGDSAAGTPNSGGIGAKLERISKKKQQKDAKKASAATPPKEPITRVALSAFAVFNQLQENNANVQDGLKKTQEKLKIEERPAKKAMVDEVVEKENKANSPKKSPVLGGKASKKLEPAKAEKQKEMPKDELKSEKPKKEQSEKHKEMQPELAKEEVQAANSKEGKKDKLNKAQSEKSKEVQPEKSKKVKPEKPTEVQPGKQQSSTIGKALSADAVVEEKKKYSLSKTHETMGTTTIQQSSSDGLLEVTKLTKKQKRKLALQMAEELVAEPAAKTLSKVEKKKVVEVEATSQEPPSGEEKLKSKDKKQKKLKQAAAVAKEQEEPAPVLSKESESETLPRPKKGKKQQERMNEPTEPTEELGVLKKKSKKIDVPREDEYEQVLLSRPRKKQLPAEDETPVIPALSIPTKKRKGDPATTPRPAKHTKLRVLQRIEDGGFFEETITPDKVRLRRNFGFEERQATPARPGGFSVSSLFSSEHEELRELAASATQKQPKAGRPKAKHSPVVPEPSRSLPLPVWTSSGVFLESPADDKGDGKAKQKSKSTTNGSASGYIHLKAGGQGDFRLKTIQTARNGGSGSVEKPHRIDPTTSSSAVTSFKSQQLLEKTAHLRAKKKGARV